MAFSCPWTMFYVLASSLQQIELLWVLLCLPKFIGWSPNPKCDCIWTKGL
jgi:hypothetical protein